MDGGCGGDPVCNRDAPVWERTWREWKGKGVRFVGIGLPDSREACRAS